MAKKSNANTIAAKKRDNRVKLLQCSVKGCEEEFYVYRHSKRKRECAAHFMETSTGVPDNNLKVLQLLGLLSPA